MLLEQARAEWSEPDCPLRTQLAAMDLPGIHQWLTEVAARLPGLGLSAAPEPLTLETIEARLRDRQTLGSKLRKAFGPVDEALVMLSGFGALLAVDKTDAALQGAQIDRQALPTAAVTVHKQRLWGDTGGSRERPDAASTLDQRRERISDTVTRTWLAHLDSPLLTLTAPTGAGKTLTVLHAALQARARLEERP